MELDDLSKTITKDNSMDKYKTKKTIKKWLSFINLEKLSGKSQKAIQSFDSYVKKLTFDRALRLFLFAINNETKSLRHLDSQLVNPDLRKTFEMDEISYSQLSRALKKLDTSVLMEIFSQLLLLVHQQTEGQKNEKIYLVNSTTFSFSQPSYPWAKFRKTKSGVKLHLSLCFMEDGLLHPEQFGISNAVEHDSDHLEVFVNKPEATYVFDRGYLDFDRFDQMHSDGYFFVTRIKKNTITHVLDEFEVKKDSDVVSDQLVILGKKKDTNKDKPFRVITIERKGQSDLRLVTNKLTPKAEEIGKMYKSRWQIELFFKHIKQHMTIKNYYSKSEDGVVNQIILAMIVYLLMLLIKLELGLKQTIFQILRVFRAVQFESYDYFVRIFDPG